MPTHKVARQHLSGNLQQVVAAAPFQGAQDAIRREAETMDIVHCDVTPGNIRLDTFGRYGLLGFGISRSTVQPEQSLAAGTPLYMSPKQLLGQPTTIRSDLYALGAVLAEALTGTPLFLDRSLAEINGGT